MTAERIHYLLTRHIIERGHAPVVRDEEEAAALRKLAEMHGVILVPGSLTIWSLHPFAMMPTRFWVTASRGSWWANCAWCALGIGAALGEEVEIATGDGGEGAPLTFRASMRPDVVMHFPQPPARWWENPYCPCGNILFFTSEAAVDAWCARHGHEKGYVMPIATGARLAALWFGDYASEEWKRKTPEQAAGIFAELELPESFWEMPGRL